MQKTEAGLIATRPHYHILDGLRGIAALSVVVFHFAEVAYSNYGDNFINHGFLAVDFFYCLSGFVIAYAYDSRIGKMGIAAFFTSRLIRLHPLVVLGAVLGILGFLFDPFGGHPEMYSAGKLLLLFLTTAFLIPLPIMEDRYFNLFGLNAPAWSLFWEYVANIAYAFFLSKISRRFLLILTLFAAAGLCFVSYRSGSLLGGWSGGTFWDGLARIAYSFLAGLLIFRSQWMIKSKLGFISLSVLLVLAFIIPYSAWNWLAEPVVVILYFPLLIALGAGATLTPAIEKICIFSGKISYPLYMTHYAAIWIFANYHAAHPLHSKQLFFVISAGTILLAGIAWMVMVWYDIPVRKYLTAKRKTV